VKALLKRIDAGITVADNDIISGIERAHGATEDLLLKKNTGLPGFQETGRLIISQDQISGKNILPIVFPCGACVTICPKCSCFLY